MKKSTIIYVILVIALLAVGVWLAKTNRASLMPIFNKARLANNTNTQPQVDARPQVSIGQQTFYVDLAIDPASQRQGLSGRPDLAKDTAMLFIFAEPKVLTFWMKDMKFNIDLVWVNGDKIVAWEKNMPAPTASTTDEQLQRYSSPTAVDKVLEFKAGSIEENNFQIGETVVFKNIE